MEKTNDKSLSSKILQNNNKLLSQKGITLIALVITIVITVILGGISVALVLGENGIITRAKNVKTLTEETQANEQAALAELTNQMEGTINKRNDGENNTPEEKVNGPTLLTGMTPVKFTEPTESAKGTIVQTTASDSNWYNYDEKKWANAQTQDGSMWVWIPRYAYKVDSANQKFDVVFLIGTTDTYYDESGNIQTAKRATSADEIVDTSTGYTVHPAFTNETSINYANGGWDKELTGIWVAKFEAGYAGENNTAQVKASSVTTEYPTFQGTTYSRNYITINDCYNIAKVLNESGNIYGLSTDSDSHLMKNSEWGATAYLAQSKYGLNGTNIYINNANLNNTPTGKYAVTGCCGETENASAVTITIENINSTTANTPVNTIYTWDQLNGQKASSTGTIYGIYDLSGGVWEYTAGYIANSNSNLKNYGQSVAYNVDTLKTVSTKYTTVYPYDTSSDSYTNNYLKNTKIYGDGVRETSTAGSGRTSWYSDYSFFPRSSYPFFKRGGDCGYGSGAGLFCFYNYYGYSYYYNGLRAVLAAV